MDICAYGPFQRLLGIPHGAAMDVRRGIGFVAQFPGGSSVNSFADAIFPFCLQMPPCLRLCAIYPSPCVFYVKCMRIHFSATGPLLPLWFGAMSYFQGTRMRGPHLGVRASCRWNSDGSANSSQSFGFRAERGPGGATSWALWICRRDLGGMP